jgi:Host cell surface-exposed lipoprotein
MRTKIFIAIAVISAIVVIGSACSEVEAETQAPATTATSLPVAVEDAESSGQENARRSAESYIDSGAFSRSGLIRQLKYEGFSAAAAIYAVDAITVDWNEQAAKSAAAYLESSSFSRSGLISQLKYEGFTQAQAAYGVDASY